MAQFGYKKIFVKFAFNKEYIISLWKKQKTIKKLEFNFKADFGFSYDKWKKNIKKKLQNSTMWGAGGKGVMLLNLLDIKSINMGFIIDSNPNLNNKFIPGTDIKVLSVKNGLKKDTSDRIAVINPLYLKEIKNTVKKNFPKKKVFSVFPNL